jgi:cytochrome c oxidase assembly factor 2
MPPHLHPRSTATSTLFAGTLLAAFVVVGIPHVFPCPRPRTGYAADSGQLKFDEDGKPVRVRGRQGKVVERSEAVIEEGDRAEERRPGGGNLQRVVRVEDSTRPEARPLKAANQKNLTSSPKNLDLDEESTLFAQLAAEAALLEQKARLARECPVPKPSGWVGRMLGFEDGSKRAGQGGNEKG